MEILFEEVVWSSVVFGLSMFAISIFIAGFEMKNYIATKRKKHLASPFVLAVFIVVTIAFGSLPKQITAKVTDIDEVYDNGYEIVDRQGENYIIRKR